MLFPLFLLPLGSFIFFCFASAASFQHLSSLLSFHSALLRFVFFSLLFAPVCCVFILSAALSSLRLLFPAPVPGFRFPFLLVLCCFRIHQGLFSLLFVFLPQCLLLSRLLGYSDLGSGLHIRLSVAPTFLRRLPLSYFGYWLSLFCVFLFPPCLPSCGSASIHQRFSRLSVVCFIVTRGSPFLLPLSAHSLLLRGFAASLAVPSLRSSFLFLLCSSVSLAVFRLLLSSFWLCV